MRIARFFAIFALLFAVTAGQTAPVPAPQQNPSLAQQSTPTSTALKTKTWLITVDVVATDSHGKAVRDLKKEDFQISEERNREQEIVSFEFVDRLANASAQVAQVPASAHYFSNVLSQRMAIPPTVLLMDALNTDITNQQQVRQHMLSLLKTLPANTPVAVFVLGRALRVVQSFSTDPGVLRAAVDKALRPLPFDQNPQDDAESPSNVALDQTDPTSTPVAQTAAIQGLEDFEILAYEAQMAIRVDETTDAMVEIAKYLGGYAGRKNLVWFSESFPIWIAPSTDFGTNPFSGSASYADKVRTAGEALTGARVAVYPVDATGLAVADLYTVTQNPHMNRQNPGRGLADQLNRQSGAHLDAQATMDNLAEDTGGRTCKNTNDLAGCVQSALNDGSSYYELAYYPQDIAWDGRFHKITIKTGQHGVKLTYRRGYFATDTQDLLKHETPEALLQEACNDPLPSTSISLTAEAISPQATASRSAESRYLLTISANALSFVPAGALRQMNVRMAVCEYNQKGDTFQFFTRDLSRPVPEDVYQGWQTQGIRNIFDYDAKPGNTRLRFAVVDVPSGVTGSLEVPAHPREFGSVPSPAIPTLTVASTNRVAPAAAPAVAPAGPSQQTITTSLTFRGSSGQSSVLDWKGDALSYRGDLGIDLGAPALFQKLVGAQFHCQSGSLMPNDANSNATPKLIFIFQGPTGHAAVVNLMESEPQYSGDLPVDPSAKPFFDRVWKLSHCQQP